MKMTNKQENKFYKDIEKLIFNFNKENDINKIPIIMEALFSTFLSILYGYYGNDLKKSLNELNKLFPQFQDYLKRMSKANFKPLENNVIN